MTDAKEMALFLVDDIYCLFLHEVNEGFKYNLFGAQVFAGFISWADICNSNICNSIPTARALAIDDIGLAGERIVQIL